jgi:hypothetical protein
MKPKRQTVGRPPAGTKARDGRVCVCVRACVRVCVSPQHAAAAKGEGWAGQAGQAGQAQRR